MGASLFIDDGEIPAIRPDELIRTDIGSAVAWVAIKIGVDANINAIVDGC